MQSARAAFDRKLYSLSPRQRRWANYSDLNGIQYAPRIRRLREEFRRGAMGERTAARSAAWREVDALTPAGRDVLELYLATAKLGLMGTIAEQRELARHVDRLSNKCKIRKVRYGLQELVESHWLLADPIPTGRRVQRSNGEWCTCQVLQYTITPKLLSLLSGSRSGELGRVEPTSVPPGGPPEEQDVCSPTDEAPRGPLQKMPTIGGEEPEAPLHGASELRLKDRSSEQTSCSSGGPPGGTEVGSTRPSSPEREPDQRTPSHDCSRAKRAEGLKGRPAAGNPRISARWRRHSARTWSAGRRALLEDLQRCLEEYSPVDRAQLLAAAGAQTARSYDRSIGCAVDWDALVFRWLDMPPAERSDELRARVVPALKSWFAPIARAGDLRRKSDRVAGVSPGRADHLRRLSDRELTPPAPEPRITVSPCELQELLERLPWARTLARGVASGTIPLEALGHDSRQLLERCVVVFGELIKPGS